METPSVMRLYPLLLSLALLLTSAAQIMAASEEEQALSPLYYELAPSLVANVQQGARYARADIQLMTRAPEALDEIVRDAPAIRHELPLLLGEQEGSLLKTPRGKEKLRKRALKAARSVMEGLTGDPLVEDLYFTSFFVQ